MAVGPDAKLLNHDDPTEVFFSIDLDRQAKIKKRKVQNEKPPSRINLKKNDEYKNDMVEDMFKKKDNRENNIQNIEKLGFNKEYCCPDGNCFFHALEFLTGMSHQALRKGIVTRMKIQSNVYNQLFTDQLKMKYYIEDATLEERFQRMAKDRTWAGFIEKISASHFIGKNILEAYEMNNEIHWNAFFGTTDPRVLEQNSLSNIYIHYDSQLKHFSPLSIKKSFTGSVKITNIYCLLADGQENNGVFIHINPSDLTPNHNMFQNLENIQLPNQPVGLMNLGNTCYLNSLFQCLHALPIYVNAVSIDKMHMKNEDGLVLNIYNLFTDLSCGESFNNLTKQIETIMKKIRIRFKGQFIPGHMEDPQEFLLHVTMIVNEEQKRKHEVTTFKNFPDLMQTKQSYENCNRSNTTQITTIYTKVVRMMHSTCVLESFEALPFLSLQFLTNSENSTSIEALLGSYLKKKNVEHVKRCPTCNLPGVHMTQQISLAHLPDILIFTVER